MKQPNPVDVAAELIRAKAAKEGLELADDFDEQVAKWRAYLEEPVAVEDGPIEPPEDTESEVK